MTPLTTDLATAAGWCGVLAGGLGVCVGLRRLGVATTRVRDLLHVGAGVWVLGWRGFHAPAAPVALTLVAVVVTAAVPFLARRVSALAALRDAVSDGDERWTGLVLYAVAFALFTALGTTGPAALPAAALFSLTLGDGIGGAVGRRFGRHFYSVGGGKRKSVEGSLAVAAGAALGTLAAFTWFGAAGPALARVAVAALVAAVAEAAAPRSTDNLVVPVAVYAALRAVA